MKRKAVFFLVVAAVMSFARPAGAAFTNLLQDSGFEANTPNPFWTEASTNFGTPLCTVAGCGNGGGTAGPLSGTVWGWFGGIASYEAGSLSQSVRIPLGVARLEFYFWVGTTAGDTADNFTASIDGDTLFTADATQNSLYPAYTLVSLDVSAYADNATHTVEFASGTNASVNFNLDNASLLHDPGVKLTISKAGTGAGTVTSADSKINCGSHCTAYYLQGDNTTLAAVAAAGSTFAGWSGGGCSGTDNCTLILNADQTVTATFNTSTPPASGCVDADNDTYGDNCSAGPDCDDTDAFYTDICPDCTVKIFPKVLGWLIGDKEKTRTLLVIGARGTEFGDTPEIKWESDAVEVLRTRVFFKRFMFMRAKFNGEPLEKEEYRVLVGSCEGKIKWAK